MILTLTLIQTVATLSTGTLIGYQLLNKRNVKLKCVNNSNGFKHYKNY